MPSENWTRRPGFLHGPAALPSALIESQASLKHQSIRASEHQASWYNKHITTPLTFRKKQATSHRACGRSAAPLPRLGHPLHLVYTTIPALRKEKLGFSQGFFRPDRHRPGARNTAAPLHGVSSPAQPDTWPSLRSGHATRQRPVPWNACLPLAGTNARATPHRRVTQVDTLSAFTLFNYLNSRAA